MKEQDILQILLGELKDKLNRIQPLVIRDTQFPNAPNKIKVAIGMRRAGKTYFVYQYMLELLQQGIPFSQLLYINFEDDRLLPLDRIKLANLIDSFFALYPENHEKKCYIFLDEIQNIEDWALVIRRLHDSKNIEIFLTGSSAKLLSKEIATQLRGRSLSTEIWPYSFNEWMHAKNMTLDKSLFDKKTEDQLNHHFLTYIKQGGFPETLHYAPDVHQATLQEYIELVIYKDIIERYDLKNSSIIKYMILTMLNNVGSSFSINKFYNDLKSQGYKITKDILYEYANYIEDAYLLFKVSLYDRSIRKVKTNPAKLYAVDPGIILASTLNITADSGHLFENIIYLELRRLGCQINYYLTKERYEIDFLIKKKNGQRKLLQIVWNMSEPKTYERELRALRTAENELGIPGEIVTLNTYLKQDLSLII